MTIRSTVSAALAALALTTGAALAVPISQTGGAGSAQPGDSFTVFESFSFPLGTYDVWNDTSGALIGFGVSNSASFPVIYDADGLIDDTAVDGTSDNGAALRYSAFGLTSGNWDTSEVSTGVSFSDVFGGFSTVSGGESVINWFQADDGLALASGDSVSDYFGFFAPNVASSVIGAIQTTTGVVYFTAGQALTGVVPLPAAGWLMLAALGGLGVAARRKRHIA